MVNRTDKGLIIILLAIIGILTFVILQKEKEIGGNSFVVQEMEVTDDDMASQLRLIRQISRALSTVPRKHGDLVTEKLKNFSDHELALALAKIIEQRNNLSWVLNLKQQQIGIYECARQVRTSHSGGWCQKDSPADNSNQIDTGLANMVAKLLAGKTIGSFGDGPGSYKQLILDSGLVKSYDAYDGAPYSEETSEGRVMFLDLTLPQFGLPMYDWIISLDVAEHIPRQYEKIYIDNIVRHAREGIILSWAVPVQGELAHVSQNTHKYVLNFLDRLGFKHDVKSSKMLQNASSHRLQKANISVFRRKSGSERIMRKLDALYS